MDSRAGQDDLEKRIELSPLSLPNISLVTVRTKLIRLPFKSFLYFPSLLDLSLQTSFPTPLCIIRLGSFLLSQHIFPFTVPQNYASF